MPLHWLRSIGLAAGLATGLLRHRRRAGLRRRRLHDTPVSKPGGDCRSATCHRRAVRLRGRRQGRCVYEVRQAGGGRSARRRQPGSHVQRCGYRVRGQDRMRQRHWPLRTVQHIFTQSCALSSCLRASPGRAALPSTRRGSRSRAVGRPSQGAVGKTLVVPGSPDDTYLIKKLKGTASVGDQMPQGGEPLSKGTIKLIERWIARGALTTEQECPPADSSAKRPRGRKSCNDQPRRAGAFVWTPEPAPPPPSSEGASGIQFYTPPLDVAAGKEWEKCYAFKGVDGRASRLSSDIAGSVASPQAADLPHAQGQPPPPGLRLLRPAPGAIGLRLLRLLGGERT